MSTREERRLIKRERELLETLAARRTPSQRQADMVTRRSFAIDDDAEPVVEGTNSERQARAVLRIDVSEETEREAKRRRISEAFNRGEEA